MPRMNFPSLENFLFVPDLPGYITGTAYELKESTGYEENSFVLLPYQNPQIKSIEARFYRIINKIPVTKLDTPQQKKQNSITLKAGTSKADYIKKVSALKNHIQLGNIYEINYCIQFSSVNIDLDPLQVFLNLVALAKPPYPALVKLGDDYIISASPELFLKKEGSLVSSKPIKGTTRRGKDKEEDETLKMNLYNSLKERTENVMAVDVARNDLSQFAEKGTVKVNRLYNIETFETVHQMVSTVSCEMKPNTPFEKIITSTFPMASMTGAPKLRAMQLIDEFENFDRNFYSGAMGIIDENDDFTLSVIIRSIFYNSKTKFLSLAAGGAITYLSEPEKEYEECLLKAKALLTALDAIIID